MSCACAVNEKRSPVISAASQATIVVSLAKWALVMLYRSFTPKSETSMKAL